MVGSDITRYKIIVIVVCESVVNECHYFFCNPCSKSYLWNEIASMLISRNQFVSPLYKYVMRFRLKSPAMIVSLFSIESLMRIVKNHS